MTDQKQTTDDLRPWGWAPGNYLFICAACLELGIEGDKRSWRCEPCARKAKAIEASDAG
jgi:hypothetical protein